MSEPFDEAIRTLEHQAKYWDDDYAAAIRVLEAAGKIPIYNDEGRLFICYKDEAWKDFAGALFAALPDKVKP